MSEWVDGELFAGQAQEAVRPLIQMGGGGATPTDPLVVGCSNAIAATLVEKYHYSHTMPSGKNISYAWYISGDLYAVAVYGIGVNPHIYDYLSSLVGSEINSGNLMELRRLARTEPRREGLYLSQFLAVCHRLLHKSHGTRFILAYSDPKQGHSGGIYKASGFRFLGNTGIENHTIDEYGTVRHRRYYYRYARRRGISAAQARRELGLVFEKQPPKARWLRALAGEEK